MARPIPLPARLLAPALLSLSLWACGAPVTVDAPAGSVSGTEVLGITRFLGVPYAEPPTGPRRFRPPVERGRFAQQLEAKKLGPICPQEGGSAPYDEDCLTLNIWSPKPASGARLPVMLFLHGGSFVGGSGGESVYEGSDLSRKGQVVVVTVNYRLGPLGFLAHPALVAEDEHKSAGNYGLLDQQLAMRWVQRNIDAFGGDPGNVTLFGESAGAGSVCAHLISPLAAGLFHRAIAQSGGCYLASTPLLDVQGQPYASAVSYGRTIAGKVGCEGAADAAACLRGKSVEQLLAAAPYKVSLDRFAAGYGPNLDGWVMPPSPRAAFEGGSVNRVPYLSGANKDEGTIFLVGANIPSRAEFERLVRAAVPGHGDAAVALYPEARYPDPKAATAAFLGDFAFVCHLRLQARLWARIEPRTYFYHFTRANLTTSILGLGVPHALELPYVFHNFPFPLVGGEAEERVSDLIIGYWTRFARTGDPGGAPVAWPAMTEAGEYLELDATPKAGTRLKAEVCDLLESWMRE